MERKILIVDDEPSISKLIEFNLKLAGYDVYCVNDGEAVFSTLTTFRPDLIVLDLMLPKMNGIEVCRTLREQKNAVPIIILTALNDTSDKIQGLENGADDYMTKPFSPQELISRISAILRRIEASPHTDKEEIYSIGNIHVIVNQRQAFVNNKAIELTPKEFELLVFLCKHSGRVLSRQQLLNGVWDYHFLGDTRIVDVHISHLREKIERNVRNPEYITTIRSVGYMMQLPSSLKNNFTQSQ